VLRLTGHVAAIIPGDRFEHDFSQDGPEGPHGPAREGALLTAGAITIDATETTASSAARPRRPIATKE
jgi:hypothetical protein